MGLLAAIHLHGSFIQKIRAAHTSIDKLKAIRDYEQYMDEVENNMIATHQVLEGYHLGKTAD